MLSNCGTFPILCNLPSFRSYVQLVWAVRASRMKTYFDTDYWHAGEHCRLFSRLPIKQRYLFKFAFHINLHLKLAIILIQILKMFHRLRQITCFKSVTKLLWLNHIIGNYCMSLISNRSQTYCSFSFMFLMCNSTTQLVTAIITLYMLSTQSQRWTIKIKLNWMTTIYQWSGLNVAVAAAAEAAAAAEQKIRKALLL